MSKRAFGVVDFLQRLLDPPDDLLLEAGAVGEVLVARVRLVVVALIVLMPFNAWWSGARTEEVVTGFVMGSVALVFAVFLLYKARRHGADVRWRFASAGFDVTSVSLVLGLFLFQGLPHLAVNSRVVWELYLIAIAATALRADTRVCLFAGALGLAQYSAILYLATGYGDLNDPRWAPFLYGHMNWGDQMSRLLLILAATLLALGCVFQTRKLLLMSSEDRLTGIRNRAWLDTRLDRALNEADLNKTSLCLAMIDVDGFKPFNDRHGHLAGDAALRAIAQRLQQRFQPKADLARYGGEEFTAVLPATTFDEARVLCEAVRARFEDDRIELPTEPVTVASPTLSMGLAHRQPGESVEQLTHRADRALLRAKQAGRNQVARAAT